MQFSWIFFRSVDRPAGPDSERTKTTSDGKNLENDDFGGTKTSSDGKIQVKDV